MVSICSNGRPLVISTKATVESDIGTRWIPCVIILTAWTVVSTSVDLWKPLMRFLLKRPPAYIVCIGTFSEKLHDEIDELLYQYDDEYRVENSRNISTTYHVDDTIEETAAYCIYGTEFKDKNNDCILAILDKNLAQDKKVVKALNKV